MRILKAYFFVIFATFLFINLSYAADNISKLINTFYPGYKLLQFSDLDSFTQEYLSGYKFELQPGFVKADFDGNNLSDFALFLNNKSNDGSIFCIILQTAKNDYELHEIIKYDRMMDYVVLSEVKPDTLVKPTTAFDTGQSAVILEYPGVKLTYVGKASLVYYWNKKTKKFDSIQTSD